MPSNPTSRRGPGRPSLMPLGAPWTAPRPDDHAAWLAVAEWLEAGGRLLRAALTAQAEAKAAREQPTDPEWRSQSQLAAHYGWESHTVAKLLTEAGNRVRTRGIGEAARGRRYSLPDFDAWLQGRWEA
jgi:hypothetical protein